MPPPEQKDKRDELCFVTLLITHFQVWPSWSGLRFSLPKILFRNLFLAPTVACCKAIIFSFALKY